jgi:hypothetical protein
MAATFARKLSVRLTVRLLLGAAALAALLSFLFLYRPRVGTAAHLIGEYGSKGELSAFTRAPSAFADARAAAAWRAARAADVAALVASADAWRAGLAAALLADGDDPFSIAVHGFARFGVWPIAFSRPLRYMAPRPPAALAQSLERGAVAALGKAAEWSAVIPGNFSTYRFYGSEEAYYAQYRAAWKAWTMRKSGVDCNRHLEIIGSGAIPVFKKIADIVPTTMFNYPKRLLAFALENKDEKDEARLATLRHFLLHWAHDHLTAVAHAQYLARAADFRAAVEGLPPLQLGSPGRRVVYINERLPREVDYMALFTLIGLVEWLGHENVDVLYPVPYMYAGGPTTCEGGEHLYGGGFGFVHYFPAEYFPRAHDAARIRGALRRGEYAAAVWGSIRRSEHMVADASVVSAYAGQPHRLWLLDGEDEYNDWAPSRWWWWPHAWSRREDYMCFARELGTDSSYEYVWGTSALATRR